MMFRFCANHRNLPEVVLCDLVFAYRRVTYLVAFPYNTINKSYPTHIYTGYLVTSLFCDILTSFPLLLEDTLVLFTVDWHPFWPLLRVFQRCVASSFRDKSRLRFCILRLCDVLPFRD